MLATVLPVLAYQAPGTGNTATKTFESGLTAAVATATGSGGGGMVTGTTNYTIGSGTPAPVASDFSPQILTTTNAIQLRVNAGGCAWPVGNTSQQFLTCADRGTLTITFSQPVTNPILHIAGLGGGSTLTSPDQNYQDFGSRFTLRNGVTVTKLTDTGNLQASGSVISVTTLNGAAECRDDSFVPNNPLADAGCGSVRINGTVSSLVMDAEFLAKRYDINSNGQYDDNGPDGLKYTLDSSYADAFQLTITVDEDFGDITTATRDPSVSAGHVVGGLRIGANITADSTSTRAPDPNPAGNTNGTANVDSDDFSWPTIVRSTVAVPVTVPISGTSAGGTLCGWIDRNNASGFEAGEGNCQSFSAGATSATLQLSVPTGTATGTYVGRLRTIFATDTALTTSTPTGRRASGEVEDAMLTVSAAPPVSLTKAWTGATTGHAVSLAISGAGVSNASAGSSTAPATTTPATALATEGSTVTVTETFTTGSESGYVTTLSCVDGDDASALTVTAAGTNPVRYTFTMPTGQGGATCSYSNVARGSIVVVLDAQPNDAQDFAYTTTGSGLSNFSLDDDADGTLANTRTFANLAAGSYSVAQGAVTGWSLSNLVCSDPDGGSGTAGATATLDLDPGETITCTYSNARLPRLTLTKTVTNDNGGTALDTAWTLSATGPSTISGSEGAGAISNAIVSAGSYTLAESGGPANYVASNWTCSGATVTVGNQITLADGDIASCDIVNNDSNAVDLSITKTDSRSTYLPGDTATYVLHACNAGPATAPNTPISDTLPAGVSLTGAWSCVGSGGGSCSAASGGIAGGTSVSLTATLPAGACVDVSVPVRFSSDAGNY